MATHSQYYFTNPCLVGCSPGGCDDSNSVNRGTDFFAYMLMLALEENLNILNVSALLCIDSCKCYFFNAVSTVANKLALKTSSGKLSYCPAECQDSGLVQLFLFSQYCTPTKPAGRCLH